MPLPPAARPAKRSVFLLIVSRPIGGPINYFNNGRGDGIITIALAAATAGPALTRKFKLVTFTGPALPALVTRALFRLIRR